MDWIFAVALAIAVLVIFIPVAFIWFLNIGGLYHAMKERGKEEKMRTAEVDGKVVRVFP